MAMTPRSSGGIDGVQILTSQVGKSVSPSLKILQLQIEIKRKQGLQSTDRKSDYALSQVQPFLLSGRLRVN